MPARSAGPGRIRSVDNTNMPESDILLTVAELSVAFAGFATLAGVLGKPRSAHAAFMNAARLRGMLESAVLALAFALIPFVPFLFGLDQDASWRLAAVGFLMANATRQFFLFRRLPGIRAAGASTVWLTVILVAQTVSSFVLLAVVAGLAGSHAGAAYVLSLFIALFASAVFFLRLAETLVATHQLDA